MTINRWTWLTIYKWAAALIFLSSFIVVPSLIRWSLSPIAVAGIYLPVLFYADYKVGYWPCPRCHLPFHYAGKRLGFDKYSWFNARCGNCGLPRGDKAYQ
jgi:hypothetical protein